jgi:hypothetical protein
MKTKPREKNMKSNILQASIITCTIILTACGGGAVKDIPSKPDASGKYIFYLHGSTEETEGSTEKYQTAINAIAASSATVISEVRGDTDPNTHAEKIKRQVELLIQNGVKPNNITISGFSKGAIIALAAADTINNSEINYVLLAGCSDELNTKYDVDPTKAAGRILSIYDADDGKFGSCHGTLRTSEKVTFEEIELETGKGHALFRIPKEKFIEQWRNPLIDWAGA